MIGWSIAGGVFFFFVLIMWLTLRSALKSKPLVMAAKANFFNQMGYPWWGTLSGMAEGAGQVRLQEGEFVFRGIMEMEGTKHVSRQSWRLIPNVPAHASFRLIDKRFVGLGRAIVNLFSQKQLDVATTYPGPHPIGNPALDARFAFFAPDPDAARGIILRPDVADRLNTLPAVILDVGPDGVAFSDPSDANMWHFYDAAGFSRMAMNPAPCIDSATKVHVLVRDLVTNVARSIAGT